MSATLPNLPEPFVNAEAAAAFLAIQPRHLLNLARAGKIPAHPIGDGPRKTWRFRLSELAEAFPKKTIASKSGPGYGKAQAVLGS